MRVLAVGAHPDDLEILCGGTLAKYVSQGAKVFMANICNGNRGTTKYSDQEIIDIRRNEAKAAADVIGAEYLEAGFVGDCEVTLDLELRDKVTDLIRKAKPDVIITLSPNDYVSDHVYTGRLVFDASHAASIERYVTKEEPFSYRTPIFCADTIAGVNFYPEYYVDVSDFVEQKIKMIQCHKSQDDFLGGYRDIDIVEDYLILTLLRGLQVKVPYAEAFNQVKVFPRVRAERLLP